jgi:TIGR03009 family protein
MRRSVRSIAPLIVALASFGAVQAWGQNPPERAPALAPPAPAAAQGEGQAQDQGAAAPAAAAVDPKKLAEVLGLWEHNSARLQTLDVTITRVDRSPAWGEDDHYEGRAMLKSPNRAWLDFNKVVVVVDPKTGEKKQTVKPYERIICTGEEVWQYRSETKQIFIYPLEKDMQQRALEEGPLPFLFNFKEAEAKSRYQMNLVAENNDFSLIQIIPRLEIDKQSFTKAWVKLDRKIFLLPAEIFLLSPDGKSSKHFKLHLNKQVANKPVMDENFQGKEIPKWKVVRNPGGDEVPAGRGQPPRVGQAAPAVGQPAPAQPGTASGTAAQPPGQQSGLRSLLRGGRRN